MASEKDHQFLMSVLSLVLTSDLHNVSLYFNAILFSEEKQTSEFFLQIVQKNKLMYLKIYFRIISQDCNNNLNM